MEYKKDLTQIALTALILASAAPMSAQADYIEPQSLFLATSCAAHGCPSPNKQVVADHNAKSSDLYNTRNSSYQADSQPTQSYGTPTDYSRGDKPKGNNSDPSSTYYNNTSNPSEYRSEIKGNNQGQSGESSNRPGDFTYSNSRYNSQRSGTTSPVYVEDYHSNTYDTSPKPTPEYGAMTNLNREYNTTTDYDYNRASVSTTTSSATLNEAQLLGLLNSQGRAIYLSLDPEAKALAIQLASQDSYKDKNLAIKEAQRRMNERRGLMNR